MEHQSPLPANRDLEHAQNRDRLTIFREEIGITDLLPVGSRSAKRTAKNIGIYRRVVSAENNARIQYYASACLINSCLLLQIIFAAALTSLGAANGSRNAITGIGAANTVIAGLLSFFKGQGLPNKLMQYQNALRKVREYIEQRERDFAQLDCNLDLNDEIRAIVDMYESVRSNDEANDPNAYHNSLNLSAVATAAPKDNSNGMGLRGHSDGHHDREMLGDVAKKVLAGRHNCRNGDGYRDTRKGSSSSSSDSDKPLRKPLINPPKGLSAAALPIAPTAIPSLAPQGGQEAQPPHKAQTLSSDELHETLRGPPGTTDAQRQQIYQRMVRHREERLAREGARRDQGTGASISTNPITAQEPTLQQEQRRRELQGRLAAIEHREGEIQARAAATQASANATPARGAPPLSLESRSTLNLRIESTRSFGEDLGNDAERRSSNISRKRSAPHHASNAPPGRPITREELLGLNMMQTSVQQSGPSGKASPSGKAVPSDIALLARKTSSVGRLSSSDDLASSARGDLASGSRSKGKQKASTEQTTRQEPRSTKVTKPKALRRPKDKAPPTRKNPPSTKKPPIAEGQAKAKATPTKPKEAPRPQPAAPSKKGLGEKGKGKGKSTSGIGNGKREKAGQRGQSGHITKNKGTSKSRSGGPSKKSNTTKASISKAKKTTTTTTATTSSSRTRNCRSGAASATTAPRRQPRPRAEAAAANPLPPERPPNWRYRRNRSPIQLRSTHGAAAPERLDYDHRALDDHLSRRRARDAGNAGRGRGRAPGADGRRRASPPPSPPPPRQSPPGGAAGVPGVFVENERAMQME
ncbi:MAG: hypothetical protein Q9217_001741 [Psora testacea]